MFAKKALGQNFLMHAQTGERIADAAGITKEDTVLEIGPGTGLLTKALLTRAKKVVAIEKDAELLPVLQETFAAEIASGKLELIEGDVRSFDPATLGGEYLLVANIPYYITGEILRQFLSAKHKPTSLTLLVQKEVAERIARDKKGSVLSISVRAYGEPHYRFTVPRGAFRPAPNVDSAVLSVELSGGFASLEEEERFFEVVKTGFMHKRKLLAGNLEAIAPKEAVTAALEQAGVPLKARAETLSVTQWRELAKAMHRE